MCRKKRAIHIISILLVAAMLLPCMTTTPEAVSGSYAPPQGSVLVTDYQIRDRLYTKAIEQIYDGTYVEVDYENTPES